ncbi:alpha/beta hydrolase [Terrarubrum flagellatum]|uniref:alpha/beta hydrolase n=1 Tax=Terrirubrum flagellatum TaxID=2895980 RepID=UPI0031451F02
MTDAASKAATRAVFLDYDQAALDKAYDQRAWAANAEQTMARCREAGDRIRATLPMRADVRYGDGPDETLDIFPCNVAGAPVHVHIHGGAWRIQSKHDASFLAPAMTAMGAHFVAIDFTNLPACRMTDMADQIARALVWVHRHVAEFGGDPDSILLSGHSSGAHLAAVMLTFDWPRLGCPADFIKAALCVSGAYDLGPVLLSARRSYIELTAGEAERLSPSRHASRINCPVTLVYGEYESPEFIRQAQSFSRSLNAAGRKSELILAPALDHFAINEALGLPGSLPHQAAARLAQRLKDPV